MAQPTCVTFQRSAVVRMINLCDGINKRFCCKVLHQPANWFRSHLQQIPSPLVPPSTAFSLVRFYPTLYSSLPKSQLPLTTHFRPTFANRRGDTSLPMQRRSQYHGTAPITKISQGFPPITGSNKLISSYPASVNFCARRSLCFVDTQLIKTA